MEAQFREDQQDLKTREQKRKAEVQRGYAGLLMKMTGTKRTSHVQDEMRKLMHHDEQDLLSLWEGCHWDDIKKAGGLIQNCAPRKDVQTVECIRRHRMYTRVSREVCLRETGRHPS